jgi:hypothetical protein
MHQHRALVALASAARDYPDCWRRFDDVLFGVRAEGVSWPSWCWAPMAAAYAVASNGARLPPEKSGEVGRLAALAAWRPTQGIYRFDASLLDALWDSDVDGALPVSVLTRLPEWCVYLELPGRQLEGGLRLEGCWAHLESDANDGHMELRFLLDTHEGLLPMPLHLGMGAGTLVDGAQAATEEMARQIEQTGEATVAEVMRTRAAASLMAGLTRPLVSVLLYLCTTTDSLTSAEGAVPSRPSPKPARRGEPPRFLPPVRPSIYEAGARLGAALREARAAVEGQGVSSGGGRTPVGHVRRAHWHAYWVGPRGDAELRRREVRWLPPIFVNLPEGQAVEPVIRTVLKH